FTPVSSGGDIFSLVVRDESIQDFEVMYCTARSDERFTVERGKEGTTAREWPAGAKIIHTVTKGFFEQRAEFLANQPVPFVEDFESYGHFSLSGDSSGPVTLGDFTYESYDSLEDQLTIQDEDDGHIPWGEKALEVYNPLSQPVRIQRVD